MKFHEFFSPSLAGRMGLVEARFAGEVLDAASLAALRCGLEITGLCYDSRQVAPGNLFFALPGIHADGRAFVAGAVERGACAVVHQGGLDDYREGALYLQVKDSRFAMSPLADAFYGAPSRRLAVAGVTGTEGKSTTVYLIYQLLCLLGKKAGFISTVRHGDGIAEYPNPEHQTTPEAITVQALLARMCENGAEYAVLEASSHGLSAKTNRLGDVIFDAAVLTNVTHEHLEFHKTWEQYRNDKAELFRALERHPETHIKLAQKKPVPCFGVINADDNSAPYFAAATTRTTFTYSVRGAQADLSVKRIASGSGGNRYEAEAGGEVFTVEDHLPGAYNAGNVLAALLTVAGLLGVGVKSLIPLVPALKPVRGRMTGIEKGQDFEVIVDYAHTPSSFEAVLPPLRERLAGSGGRLIVLFGSAGERDTQKRPEQGRIAASYADIVVLADEDPRGEAPLAILEEIAGGIANKERGVSLFLIPDRPLAIRKAFSLARKGDLVILLGKGHENSIIYADRTMPYDEIAEAEAALEEHLDGRQSAP